MEETAPDHNSDPQCPGDHNSACPVDGVCTARKNLAAWLHHRSRSNATRARCRSASPGARAPRSRPGQTTLGSAGNRAGGPWRCSGSCRRLAASLFASAGAHHPGGGFLLGRCLTGVDFPFEGSAKLRAVATQPHAEIVQRFGLGKTQRAPHEPREPGPQLAVLARAPGQVLLPHGGLRCGHLARGGSPAGRVQLRETTRLHQLLPPQAARVLPPADPIRHPRAPRGSRACHRHRGGDGCAPSAHLASRAAGSPRRRSPAAERHLSTATRAGCSTWNRGWLVVISM